MSRDNVEAARRAVEAFNAGGTTALLNALDPEIEWRTTGLYVEPGTYRGFAGIRDYLGGLAENLDDLRNDVEEFIEVGERVVLPCRISGRGKESGAVVNL